MLSEDQIHYLFQIRDTTPALPERTVRVMLGALRWSPEQIEHAINFLKMPPADPRSKPPAPIQVEEPMPIPIPPKQITIKQNPFPIGSPLMRSAKRHEEIQKKPENHFVAGIVLGFVVVIAGVILYVKLSS